MRTFKILVFLLFSLIQLSLNAQDIRWISTDNPGVWEDPNNWDLGRLPTLADDVLIEDQTSDGVQVIQITTPGFVAQAKTLVIDILNFRVNENTTLHVADSISITPNITSYTHRNHGTIKCPHIRLNGDTHSSALINEVTGLIDLDLNGTGTNGVFIINGELENEGVVQNGRVEVLQQLTNKATGTMVLKATTDPLKPVLKIDIDKIDDFSIFQSFDNHGEIRIEQGNSTPHILIDILHIEDDCINHNNIFIKADADFGLRNSSKFENRGLLSIEGVFSQSSIENTDNIITNEGIIRFQPHSDPSSVTDLTIKNLNNAKFIIPTPS